MSLLSVMSPIFAFRFSSDSFLGSELTTFSISAKAVLKSFWRIASLILYDILESGFFKIHRLTVKTR